MALPAWAPTTAQTAVYAPWLTVSLSVPGSQDYVNDFTSDTSPGAAIALRHMEDAANLIGVTLTTVPAALQPLASTVVARYAAATLAAAYARTAEDAQRAAAMLTAAQALMKSLIEAGDNAGAAALDPVPVAYAPDPVPWGDDLIVGSRPRYPRSYLYPE